MKRGSGGTWTAALAGVLSIGLLIVGSKSGSFHALKDPTLAVKAYYFLEDPWRRHQAALQVALVFGL